MNETHEHEPDEPAKDVSDVSHWQSLAEQIGAHSDVDPDERKAIEVTPAPVRSPRSTSSKKSWAAETKTTPNHWQKLSAFLGISSRREEPIEDERDVSHVTTLDAAPASKDAGPSRSRGQTPTDDIEEGLQHPATKPRDSFAAFSEPASSESPASTGDPDWAPSKTFGVRADPDEAAPSDAELERQPLEPGSPLFGSLDEDPEYSRGRASQDFVDSMFSDYTPTLDPEEDTKPKYSDVYDDEPGAAEFDAIASETDEVEFSDPVEESSEDTDRPRRGRRRRGRRRGRSPRSETSDSSQLKTEDSEDSDSYLDDVRAADTLDEYEYDEQRPTDDDEDRRPRSSPHDEHGTSRGDGKKHRKIPSWKDAVGMIVTSNLENRSSEPSGGPARRRRGGRRRSSQ